MEPDDVFLTQVRAILDQAAPELANTTNDPYLVSALSLTVTMLSNASTLSDTLDVSREMRAGMVEKLMVQAALINEKIILPGLMKGLK